MEEIKIKLVCFGCGEELTMTRETYGPDRVEFQVQPCAYCVDKAYDEGHEDGIAEAS